MTPEPAPLPDYCPHDGKKPREEVINPQGHFGIPLCDNCFQIVVRDHLDRQIVAIAKLELSQRRRRAVYE